MNHLLRAWRVATALLLLCLVATAPAAADRSANLATFKQAVLSKISEDSLRPIRDAMPAVSLPARSEITNFLEKAYAALPETTQQRILIKAREFGGDIAKLDHFIFQEMLPTERLLREQIATQLPNEMFLPPKPGMQPILDKALLTDIIARGVLALPRIQQVALLTAIRKQTGNTGAILRIALAGLGPGYVKLGQMLGNRPGLLSAEIRAEVAKLSSEATPAPYADVLDQIDKELETNAEARAQRKPGKRLVETLFSQIDRKPLGVGSLGQIHLATLRDGRRVVIKILKPGAAAALMRNLDTFTELVAQRPNASAFKALVDNFREVSEAEIDYLQERRSTMEMGPLMAALGVAVPRIYAALSGADVLVQELAVGRPVTHAELKAHERALLAPRVLGAALANVLITGRFHGDLHEGNIFAGKDAAGQLRLTFIDWGMTLRISVRERLQFVAGLVAAALHSKALIMRLYGVPMAARAGVQQLLKDEFAKPGNAFDRLQRGMTVIQSHGGTVPPNVIHAARTLMLAQGVAEKLNPALAPSALARFVIRHAGRAARARRGKVDDWQASMDAAKRATPKRPTRAGARPRAMVPTGSARTRAHR